MGRALKRWLRRHRLGAVIKLRDNAESTTLGTEAHCKALAHYARFTLLKGKAVWAAKAAVTKKRRAELRRRMARSRSLALEHYSLGKWDRAVEAWRDYADASSEQAADIHRAVTHWMGRKLSKSVGLWSVVALERSDQAYLHRMAIGEWARRLLTQTLDTGLRRAAVIKEEKARAAAGWRRGVAHWAQRSCVKAVGSLFLEAERRAQQQALLDAAVLHWAESQLTLVMNHWRQHAYVWYCAKVALHGASKWSDDGALGGAIEQWRLKSQAWGARRRAKKQAEAYRLTQHQKQQLRKCWEEWRQGTLCESTGSELYNQAAFWWLHRTLDDTLARWRNYSEFRVILAELMAQADFRYYHKSYSDGFQMWRSYSDMVQDSPEK